MTAAALAAAARPAAAAPGWRPLLDGALAGRAREAAAAIGRALADPAAIVHPSGGAAALSRGHAGRALLFTSLAEALDEPAWRQPAAAALDAAVAALSEAALGPELWGGFTGVGWAVEHLAGRLFPAEEAAEATAEIDDALDTLLAAGWQGDFDLIGGLAGFAVYALEGLPRPGARRLLGRVVGELARRGEPRGGGRAWLTPARLVPPSQRERAPAGYYNLGAAHGVPGVAAVLAAAAAHGVPGAAEEAAAAVRWLLAQERGAGEEAAFANWLPPAPGAGPGAGAPRTTRLAWCYGDLGVAATLAAAARALGRADWMAAARRVARRAAARPAERSGVLDAGLCHGAGGVGHLFNRLAQVTGDDTLADAARRWLAATLDLRRPGEGVAGFLAWEPALGGWMAEPGFLTGAAGVALALAAAVSPVEPEWDRALAVSTRPAAGAGRVGDDGEWHREPEIAAGPAGGAEGRGR